MRFIVLILVVAPLLCRSDIEITDIEKIPEVKEEDLELAHIYEGLNGEWRGLFRIYRYLIQDDADQEFLENIPSDFFTDKRRFKLVDSLWVEQTYKSESPFFQRVLIRDVYTDKQGIEHTVVSRGVNKIQDGKMLCVVHKPDEIVVHEGRLQGSSTIIWHREYEVPFLKEYFHETIDDGSYTILGWGYYEGDDPTKMPPLWFHGLYKKH